MARRQDRNESSPVDTAAGESLDVVVRPRLLEALSATDPLTLVSAPAGYGKSVLVDSWSAHLGVGHTVVRMTVDEEADDPHLFWTATLEALRRSGVDVSGVRPGRTHRDALKSLVHHITAHDQHVVWILDCGEASLSADVARGVDRIMRRASGCLAVVVLTRTDPPLPLNRYRLDGSITDVRAADLVFTLGEAAELMQLQGLDLQESDLVALHARTGGWPAGLRFAGMSLRASGDTERAVMEFRGDVGNIAEYLMSEVLSKQTEETRQFLLRTCVAEELVPGLVEELWGRPCDLHTLEVMASRSAFIELVPGRLDRYRWATLFREFLNAQLAFETPELLDDLHRSAASWFARDGQVRAAIRHAALADAWQVATELFVDHLGFADLLTGREGARLRALFDDLPTDTPGAAAAVTRAALCLSDLDPETSVLHLAAAGELEDTSPTLDLAISVLAAVAASLGDDTDAGLRAALVAERALRLAPTRDLTGLLELSAVVSGCKARVLFERGDLAAGALALSRGVTSAESANLDVLTGELKGMAALVAAVTGRLRRATELALEVSPGVTSSEDGVAGPGLEAATLALAWVRTDESEQQLARELLDQAEGQLASYDSRVLGAVLSLLRARLLKDEGDFNLARAEIQSALAPVGSGPFGAPVTGWLAESLGAEITSSGLAGQNRWLREGAALEDGSTAWHVPAQRSRGPGADVVPVVMPLTAKETEVLGYLAQLLTTDEIASTMFVSVNTVRSHVRSILRKLGVGRRNEAVRRAWEMGLVPSGGGLSATPVAQ